MNNISAMLGILQFSYINKIIKKHIKNARFYDQNIKNKKISLFKTNKHSISSSWIYSLCVDDKKKFKRYLLFKNIMCDEVHYRNDKYSIFKKFKPKRKLEGMNYLEKKMLNIPVGWWVDKKKLKYITQIINEY